MAAKRTTEERTNAGGGAALAFVVLIGGALVFLFTRKKSAAATLNGTVVSGETGDGAIAGAIVAVGTKTATTDSTGKFSMTGLSAGTVAVTISATGYIAFAGSLTLVSGANTKTFQLFKTSNVAGLSGKITDANTGLALPGVLVFIGGQTATTNSTGNYAISGLALGTYTISFDLAGYRADPRTITLVAGTNTLNVTMSNLGTASIKVVDSITNAPLSGATVTLQGFVPKTTGTDGLAIFMVPSGVYGVTASKTGYATLSSSTTVYAGITTDVLMDLVKNPTNTSIVQGQVTKSSGGGIPGAQIVMGAYSTTTDVLGGYSIEVPPGIYTITASASGYISQSKSKTVFAGDITTVDFSLTSTAPNGGLYGTVRDISTGQVIAGADVWLNETAPGGAYAHAITTANGMYDFLVPPDTYDVTVEKAGYSSQTKVAIIPSGSAIALDFDLTSGPKLGFMVEIWADWLNFYPTVVTWSGVVGDAIAESFHGYFMGISGLWDERNQDLDNPNLIQWPGWMKISMYDAALTLIDEKTITVPRMYNGHIYRFYFESGQLIDMGTF